MRIQTGNRVARGFGDVLKYDVLAQVTFTETSSRDTSRLVPGYWVAVGTRPDTMAVLCMAFGGLYNHPRNARTHLPVPASTTP